MVHYLFFKVCLIVMLISSSSHAISPEIAISFDSNLQTSTDRFVEDIVQRYQELHHNEFWEPFSEGTGEEEREVVHVEKIDEKLIAGKYLEWRHSRLGLNHFLIGLKENSIDVYGSDLVKKFSIGSSEKLVTMAAFTMWNNEKNHPEIIIVAATINPNIFIYILENEGIKKLDVSWSLHNQITNIEAINVGSSVKLLLVPKGNSNPIDIYNIAVGSLHIAQFWFHQRLGTNSTSNVIAYEVGQDSSIAVASQDLITIYKFNFNTGKYTKDKNIVTKSPPGKLYSFSLGYRHFLVSTPRSEGEVEFFKFNGGEYEPTSFGSVQALEIAAVRVDGSRDEQILVAYRQDKTLQFLSYSKFDSTEQFQLWPGCQLDSCRKFNGNLANGVSFIHNDQVLFVLPTEESGTSAKAFFIATSIQETSSPLYKQSRDIFKDFSGLAEKYKRWDSIVTSTVELLQNALSLKKSNIVKSQWNVGGISANRSSIVLPSEFEKSSKVVNSFNDFTFVSSKWIDNDFFVNPDEAQLQLQNLQFQTDSAFRILGDSIPTNSEEVHIVGAKQKVSGSFNCQSFDSSKVAVVTANNHKNVLDFFSNIVMKEPSINIDSLSFHGIVATKYLQTSTLNGVHITDISRLSEENNFDCKLQLQLPINVSGHISTTTVNMFKFKEEILYAKSVTHAKLVDGLVALREAQISSPIGSLMIEKRVFNSILLKSVPQKVSSTFIFSDVQSNQLAKVIEINGENFDEKVGHVVSLNFNGHIRGHKSVNNELKCDSVSISKTLNGLEFPVHFVFASDRRIILHGHKSFNSMTVSKAEVAGLIQGIHLLNLVKCKGFVTVTEPWTLTGHAQFLDDVSVRGLVDHAHIYDLKHHDVLDNRRSMYSPKADIQFLQPVVLKNLAIEATINGETFEEIFGGILSFEGAGIVIRGKTSFRKSVQLDVLKIESNEINNHNVNNFFTTNSVQNISGTKIIESQAKFGTLFALSKFDSVELGKLFEDAFSLSQARVVSSKFYFEDIHCGSAVKVHNDINNFGTDFASGVAVINGRKNQIFQTSVDFLGIHTATARIDNVQINSGRRVAGIDIESWLNRRITLNGITKISYPLKINGKVEVKQGIQTKKLNGFELNYLASGVLRNDISIQSFEENIGISGLIRVNEGQIKFENMVSGFHLSQVLLNAFSINSVVEEHISSLWFIEKAIFNKDLDVSGTVCGVDLEHLNVDIVRRGESSLTIFGSKSFSLDLEVNHALKSKLVNSVDIFTHAFTLKTAQTISGSVEFTHNENINGNLMVHGFINGVSVHDLASVYSFDKTTQTHNLKSNVESNDRLSCKKILVNKLVQNKQFLEYVRGLLIRTTDSNVRITGDKSFLQTLDVEGLINAGSINDINISDLSSRIARKSGSTLHFTHPVKFHSSVKVSKIAIQNGDITFQVLTDVEFDKLIREAVYLDKKESLGNIKFEEVSVLADIHKIELLNSVLLTEVVTTDSDQILEDLHVKAIALTGENVVIEGNVLGRDLTQMFHNTFLRSSIKEQLIHGPLTFEGRVTVRGNLVCLGNILDKIMTVKNDYTVSSQIDFKHPIQVNHLETKNLVNGHKIEEIVSQALTQGSEEEITGHWIFTKGVTFKTNVEGESLLNGYDLSKLIVDKEQEAGQAEKLIQSEQNKFDEKCDVLDTLSTQLANSPCKLQSIDTHQTLVLNKPVTKIAYMKTPANTFLLALEETLDVVVYNWDREAQKFADFGKKHRLGDIKNWYSITIKDIAVLVYTTQVTSSSNVPAGLHFVTLNSNNEISPSKLVLSGSFNDIQLIQDDKLVDKIGLFAVTHDAILYVFEWNVVTQEFTQTIQKQLNGPINNLAVVNHLQGIAVFHHCDAFIHFDYYDWNEKTLQALKEVSFIANPTSALGLVESSGQLYGLVEAIDSVSQPSCSLQVFELSQHLKLVQKLRATPSKTISTFKFCKNQYIASFSKSVGVTIYEFNGLSGFKVFNENPIKVPNGRDMITFSQLIKEYNSNIPFIAVATGKSIEVFHSNVIGHELSLDLLKSQCRIR